MEEFTKFKSFTVENKKKWEGFRIVIAKITKGKSKKKYFNAFPKWERFKIHTILRPTQGEGHRRFGNFLKFYYVSILNTFPIWHSTSSELYTACKGGQYSTGQLQLHYLARIGLAEAAWADDSLPVQIQLIGSVDWGYTQVYKCTVFVFDI